MGSRIMYRISKDNLTALGYREDVKAKFELPF